MANGKSMISLASSLKGSTPAPAAQSAKGGAGDAASATDGFTVALAAAAPAQDGEASAKMAPAAELAGKPAPGTPLPISLRSGKTLPVLAGSATAAADPAPALAGPAGNRATDPVQDAIAHDKPAEADSATPGQGDAAQPLAILAQLPLPLPTAEGATPAPQASGAAGRKSPGATPPKGSLAGQNSALTKAATDQPPVGQVPAPSVALHVAAQATAPTGDHALPLGKAAARPGEDPRAAKEPGPAHADASSGAATAKMESQLPAPTALPPHAAVDPVRDRAHDGAKPASPIAAAHDLARVVDRLVAAREALAPATAMIALQHGELGDLSLRFDQLRDGRLAVQLSASDPDAHRAIVAAVSDAGFRASTEGQTGPSQQSAQPQANARGGSAERDSGGPGNGSAARHDQPQQRRSAMQQQQRPGDDRRRAGVFA